MPSIRSRKPWLLLGVLALHSLTTAWTQPVDRFSDEAFKHPADEWKPHCYWYWLNGEITKEGITKDLEHMAAVGIGRAQIGNIDQTAPGGVDTLSPEWEALTQHAIREGTRLGIEIFMFNSPGWSQSGGPWVTPERSMRYVSWKLFRGQGGSFSQQLRPPEIAASQDIAVLALPSQNLARIEGKEGTAKHTLVFESEQPITARGLEVSSAARGQLYVERDGQQILVADIHAAGGQPKTDTLPNAVELFSFADTVGTRFVLATDQPTTAVLTEAPTVAQAIEKQLGRMHPTPSPTWESYLFPASVEPGESGVAVSADSIVSLTDRLDASGALQLELPEGEWDIYYFYMQTTGKTNRPAAESATGLEIDKMNRVHVAFHFDAFIGKMWDSLTPDERQSFKGITADSYEVGAQNWTDGFADVFATKNAYDPLPYLISMTGRMVESAEASDQYLWDLRRTVADTIAEAYVGGLREAANERGMTLWLENYGHWGFPGDYLMYGGYSDEVSGEFWIGNGLGSIECRAASSSAANYGKNRVYAEAYTSRIRLQNHPYAFKARGEQLFSKGINHFVLHVYAHQPHDGAPGKNPWFGTQFHRNTPWFREARDWIKYLQRTHMMLQAGRPAADVAVYSGDYAPQMIGPANPVPADYSFDYLGSDALLRTVDVVDGEWVVYDEKNPSEILVRWQLLALPEAGYVRPKVLERLAALEAKGGRTVSGLPLTSEQLADAGIEPAAFDGTSSFLWDQRLLDDGGELFYLNNFGETGAFSVTLRSEGKAPVLFNPATGTRQNLARFESVAGGTRVSFNVKDRADAFFVSFREPVQSASVVGASADAAELQLSFDAAGQLMAQGAQAGEFRLEMSDGSRRTVQIDHDSQLFEVSGDWRVRPNDPEGFSEFRELEWVVPSDFGRGQRVLLDLGAVDVMAKVWLNEYAYEELWMPPFQLDVTDQLKSGRNTLKVRLTSTSESKPKLGDAIFLRTQQRKLVDPAER